MGWARRSWRRSSTARIAKGLAFFLETSDPANVGFYHRFGFDVVDDALALVPGGPTQVAMRRAAPQR